MMVTSTTNKSSAPALEDDRLLSKHGVAELLSLTPRQVEAYRARGNVLPDPVKIGKHLRWRRSEVIALFSKGAA